MAACICLRNRTTGGTASLPLPTYCLCTCHNDTAVSTRTNSRHCSYGRDGTHRHCLCFRNWAFHGRYLGGRASDGRLRDSFAVRYPQGSRRGTKSTRCSHCRTTHWAGHQAKAHFSALCSRHRAYAADHTRVARRRRRWARHDNRLFGRLWPTRFLLWRATGNPTFPLNNHISRSPDWLGTRLLDGRFLPRSLLQAAGQDRVDCVAQNNMPTMFLYGKILCPLRLLVYLSSDQ